jgi:hypothetical protein
VEALVQFQMLSEAHRVEVLVHQAASMGDEVGRHFLDSPQRYQGRALAAEAEEAVLTERISVEVAAQVL